MAKRNNKEEPGAQADAESVNVRGARGGGVNPGRAASPVAELGTALLVKAPNRSLPASMRAVVVRRFGGPDVLEVETVATPQPSHGEILVRVHYVTVNRIYDLYTRQGRPLERRLRTGNEPPTDLPTVLGADPVGVVADVHPSVSTVKVGDKVAITSRIPCQQCAVCLTRDARECPEYRTLGLDQWGGYAEYLTVPAAAAYPIPEGLSLSDACVIARPFPVAYNMLLDYAELKEGEWVLVMGAAGALGISGIQVAKLSGATVIAGAGAPERVEIGRTFGADYGVNYRSQDLEAEVARITEGHGVDVVFENVGDAELWPRAFNCLAHRGRLVTAGAQAGGFVTLDIRRLFVRRLRVIGASGALPRHIERTFADAVAGRIRPAPYLVLPLREAARAHALLEADPGTQKVVLDAGRI